MDHGRRYLIPVLVAERVKGFIDAIRQEAGNKLSFHAVEADGGCLIKLGRFFLFIFLEEKGVNVVLQLSVKAVVIGAWMVNIISDPAVYIRMAHRITDIMADKSADIGQPLFSLLA